MATIKRYANFDSNGNFKGFYSDDVASKIPSTAIEITDQQWQDLMAGESSGKTIGKDSSGNPSLLDPTLDQVKTAKLAEISSGFVNAVREGHFTLSLGWDIDCRRGDANDDVANMQGLLSIAKKNGLADTDQIDKNGIKGYDNQWHPATVADVRDTIIPEMCEYGASLYQKKFTLEGQVSAATTVADVDVITISF